jgi:hypothetical protein
VRSFVAVGDSFSEGVGDPWPDGSGCRGWADRLAEILARRRPLLPCSSASCACRKARPGHATR